MLKSILSLTLLFATSSLYSQFLITEPVALEKSHALLKVKTIEINATNTIVSLSIENQRDDGGWFCASEDIIIKDKHSGEKYNLVKSEGIPICPENHAFSSKGEVLNFKLFFPVIPTTTKKIDLVENCDQACFYFKDLILDQNINNDIRVFEKGIELVSEEKYIDAITYFKRVTESTYNPEFNIYGLSFYYIILGYHELGNQEEKVLWIEKFSNSKVPDKEAISKRLKELGIL